MMLIIATPRIITAIVPNSGTTCVSSICPTGPVNGSSTPNPRNSTSMSTGLSPEAAALVDGDVSCVHFPS